MSSKTAGLATRSFVVFSASALMSILVCSCSPAGQETTRQLQMQAVTIEMPPVSNKDVNVEFIYDGSGSMNETVKDINGKDQKKYIIANKALMSASALIQASVIANSNRNINCGMWMLYDGVPTKVFDLEKFDISKFKKFSETFNKPDGGTPLSGTIDNAAVDLLRKRAYRNYIVILSDGENNQGRDIDESIIEKTNFANNDAGLTFFIVAFDVDSRVFSKVKKLTNVIVFDAKDEKQLIERLEFIVEKKILLENE